MADDSELDYIVTLLGKIHTTATVVQIETKGNILLAHDLQRMLVFPGELLYSTTFTYGKRYKVRVSEESEANLMGAISDIILGLWKMNTRQTITDYTRPTTLIHAKLMHSNRAFYHPKSKRWDVDIFLDIDWSIS